MSKRNPDLVEQWIRRGVQLAAEMRKHGVLMRVNIAFEPIKKPRSKACKDRCRVNIKTEYWAKPIPSRNCDWSAIDDDTYDGAEDSHCPIGYGATEQEAIDDLREKLDLCPFCDKQGNDCVCPPEVINSTAQQRQGKQE